MTFRSGGERSIQLSYGRPIWGRKLSARGADRATATRLEWDAKAAEPRDFPLIPTGSAVGAFEKGNLAVSTDVGDAMCLAPAASSGVTQQPCMKEHTTTSDSSPTLCAPSSGRREVRTRWLVPVVALGGGLLLLASPGDPLRPVDEVGAPVTELSAGVGAADFDADGLTDDQELLLGTFPYVADSDEDGFGDGEEIARQSDPRDLMSVPQSSQISANITARGEGSALQLVLLVYEPSEELGDSFLRLGALRSGQVTTVPLARFASFATVSTVPASGGGQLTCIELPVHPSFVEVANQVTFFLAAGNAPTQTYTAAAKVDISSVEGILLMQRFAAAQSQIQASQGGGSVRLPIPGNASPSIPNSWVPGSICFQRSAVVGGNGPVMLHQVIEADCLQGWDTFCVSTCSAALGSTYETIDPIALIGG